MSKKWLGAIHWFFMILLAFYAFLYKKSKFDWVYLIIEYTIYWSWTFHYGKCPVSYYYAKYFEKKKDLREIETNDIITLFGEKHKEAMKLVLRLGALVMYCSLILVFRRNNINFVFGLLPFPMYYLLCYFKVEAVNVLFSYIFFFYIVIMAHNLLKSFGKNKHLC